MCYAIISKLINLSWKISCAREKRFINKTAKERVKQAKLMKKMFDEQKRFGVGEDVQKNLWKKVFGD